MWDLGGMREWEIKIFTTFVRAVDKSHSTVVLCI